MFLVSCCSCLRSINWSQVLSWEWRCSWSSADRRCSNYIWVINNFIAYKGATYIRGFTVVIQWPDCICLTTTHVLQNILPLFNEDEMFLRLQIHDVYNNKLCYASAVAVTNSGYSACDCQIKSRKLACCIICPFVIFKSIWGLKLYLTHINNPPL